MASETNNSGFWDNAELIHSYSRSQAIEDGVLVDIMQGDWAKLVRQCGINYPVAMTSAAFAQYVELSPAAKRAGNDIVGRLWDVLFMFSLAARRNRDTDTVIFVFRCVTRSIRPSLCRLKAIVGPGDGGEPVITIMGVDED